MGQNVELDEGLTRLKSIIESLPDGAQYWHEADNRFKFIDQLFIDCFGWDRLNIDVEKRTSSGSKADYVLGNPVRAAVEAKRETPLFNFPAGTKGGVPRKIKPLTVSDSNLARTVHQVIGYCSLLGCRIAVICNGPQIIIFQGLVLDDEPINGECYVFDGPSDYLDKFHILWNFLSPSGIEENRAFKELSFRRNPHTPQRARELITDANQFRYRDDFQENLRTLAEILLEEVEDNPDLKKFFYRECYVPVTANNRHLLQSKKAILSRYSRVSDNSESQQLNKNRATTDQASGKIDQSFVSPVGISRPIVVIGDVGVGKTSFFENLYSQIESEMGARSIYIHINLGKEANLSTDLPQYVTAKIVETLLENQVDIENRDFVRAIYSNEVRRFREGIYGDLRASAPEQYEEKLRDALESRLSNKSAHLHASIAHLVHGQQRQIVLIIDNADQRSFDVQQTAFLIAQELASKRAMIVFVALRPSTFHESKKTGALSGYQNRLLTISPPPAAEVIEKRIVFGLRIAAGEQAPGMLEYIQLNLSSITLFLTATLRSIRGNKDIQRFLDNISGGNTRAILELITTFFGSPNVESRKIIRIEEEGDGGYWVPLHEFTKHALLGEYSYYHPDSSNLAYNIFDVSYADRREHFLSSIIIMYLAIGAGRKDKDGFVSGRRVLKEALRLGFTDDQIHSKLRLLAQNRLIETPHSDYREVQVNLDVDPTNYVYRATSIGLYHTRFWSGEFSFIDAMSIDTPIFDQETREKVVSKASSFVIADRFDKSEAFRHYLIETFKSAEFSVNYYNFENVVSVGARSFESVERFLDSKR